MNPTTTPRGHGPLSQRQRQQPQRQRTSVIRVAAIACTAALAVAGCSGGSTGSDGAPDTGDAASATAAETVTVTATAEQTTELPPSTTAGPTGSPSAGSTTETEPEPEPTPAACSPESVPVSSDAAGIAPPFPDRGWTVWQTGNLCGSLGYAELATAGGTGSSPTQLLLYNEGTFLGTGIKCNALSQVTGSTDDSVSVQYRWPRGNDSNANMTGRTTITFQWNGSSVDMIGNLPQDAVGTAC